MEFDLLVTAVSERADLFAQSMDSLLEHLDQQPARFVVHEDVRPGSNPGEIGKWLETAKAAGRICDYAHHVNPKARGLGPAMLWCFQQARTPLVLYTQEDWLAVRPIPVARTIEIMQACGLHHVRWNKRKTMRAKHEDVPAKRWAKVEVSYAGQTFCVSDHFYTQTSMWRVEVALPAIAAVADSAPQANQFVARMNDWINKRHGDSKRAWNDQKMRDERIKTYIWGGIGEPAFIKHLGSARTTGPIVHVSELKGVK